MRIWTGDTIPYNQNQKSKFDDMIIQHSLPLKTALDYAGAVFSSHLDPDRRRMDTATYHSEIRNKDAFAGEFYADEPELIPYLTNASRTAVIVVPGGGFCRMAWDREGLEIAEELNRAGISAFVLSYRLNPYRAPVPWLDLQRAIRFVRYHAETFGLDPHRIGVLGFSAGGFLCGAVINLLRNAPVQVPGYEEDAIDHENDRPDFAGLIYPVVNFNYSPNMLSLLTDADLTKEEVRKHYAEEYDLLTHMAEDAPPQFVLYGSHEALKDADRYADILKEMCLPVYHHVVPGRFHSFGKHAAIQGENWVNVFATWAEDMLQSTSDGQKP